MPPTGHAAAPRRFSGPNYIGVGALVRRMVLGEILFFKLALLGPALQALLFALVISLALGERMPFVGPLPFLDFLAPGLVIAAILQRAFETTAFTMLHEKLEGTIADVFGAPLLAGEILAGYLLSTIAIAILIGIPVWVFLLPLGASMPVHMLATLYFLLTGIVILAAAGILAAMRSQKWDSLSAKEVFLLVPALFLSGSFFSIDQLAAPFDTLMLLNPAFHMVNGFRFAMTGHADAPVWISAAFLGVTALGINALTLVLLHRGYRIKA